jgi:septum formation protein
MLLMKTIILASASPRRKELLEKIGLKFEIEPADYEEVADVGLEAHELVQKLSREKAEAVARKHRNTVVIAADTVVLLGDKILGKPHSQTEAGKMLRSLSGKAHVVITAFTIIDTDNEKMLSKSVETKVYIRKLNPKEIDAYVKSGEPLDKAGAYAIQGLGSVIVERIEGDYFNVVGLPLSLLAESLKEFGIDVLENRVR